jgi:hypothetical protein
LFDFLFVCFASCTFACFTSCRTVEVGSAWGQPRKCPALASCGALILPCALADQLMPPWQKPSCPSSWPCRQWGQTSATRLAVTSEKKQGSGRG